MEPNERLKSILDTVLTERTLKKAILSRPNDKAIVRAEARLFEKKEQLLLQIETFTADGKALHRNLPLSEAADALTDALQQYRQLNLITTGGDIEAKRSSKGKLLVSGKLHTASPAVPALHKPGYHSCQKVLPVLQALVKTRGDMQAALALLNG